MDKKIAQRNGTIIQNGTVERHSVDVLNCEENNEQVEI